jgi:two-component system, NarL family, invasion response regulator UvrY
MIKILIADDHPVVRKGMKQILSEEPDVVLVGEASSIQEALTFIQREKWDILVLDITMPGRGGLDLLAELKQNHPRLPVLIFSMHSEEQYGVRALKSGAAGYLSKESPPTHLIQAIRQILSGRKYVSPVLTEKLALDLNQNSQKPLHEALSDREHQVLCLLASGKTVSEIGKEFCLSIKTISTYRSRILHKMKMKTNAELTRYAITNQLID